MACRNGCDDGGGLPGIPARGAHFGFPAAGRGDSIFAHEASIFYTDIMRVTNNGVALASVAGGGGNKSPPCLVEFQRDGIVMACCAGTVEGGGITAMAVNTQVNNTAENLTTNGNFGTDFINFATLFGATLSKTQPLIRRVRAHDKWNIQFQNNGIGGHNNTPEMNLFLLERAYAERMPEYAPMFANDSAGNPYLWKPLPTVSEDEVVFAASRWMRVSGFVQVGAASTGVAVNHTFQEDGIVVGVAGTTLDDGSTGGMSGIGVQIIAENGTRALVSNGATPDFAQFANCFGLQSNRVMPLIRRVKRDERWTFTVKNFSNPGTAFTPEMTVYVLEDAIARQFSALQGLLAL